MADGTLPPTHNTIEKQAVFVGIAAKITKIMRITTAMAIVIRVRI